MEGACVLQNVHMPHEGIKEELAAVPTGGCSSAGGWTPAPARSRRCRSGSPPATGCPSSSAASAQTEMLSSPLQVMLRRLILVAWGSNKSVSGKQQRPHHDVTARQVLHDQVQAVVVLHSHGEVTVYCCTSRVPCEVYFTQNQT